MQKFTLRKAEEVGLTKIPLYKLCSDGVCTVDADISALAAENSFDHEIPGLYAILKQACNLLALPKTKYHPLQIKGISGNVHEAKTRNLRMYTLQIPASRKVVVLISKKNSQDKDLRKLTSLLKLIEDQEDLFTE